jgi:hypothetical protein
VTLQQIADEIVNNPKLRVLYVGQNHPRAMDFILALARLLPTSLIEKVRRQQILCMGWDGRNPTVTAMGHTSSPAGYRFDLIVVESDSPWWPLGIDEMNYRTRLVLNGRVEFFSWDAERRPA